jgi:T5SS/PEP-CTERM-associated repeat protein
LRVGSGEVTFRSNLRATYTLDNPSTGFVGRGIDIATIDGETAVLNSSLLTLTSAAATIGDAAGSEGTLNLNSGTFNVTGDSISDHELIVGNLGNGTLNVPAGARVNVPAVNGSVIVGNQSGSTGTINVTGAGANVTVGSSIHVGNGVGISGTFNVSNGGQVTVQNGDIDTAGTRITGGTVNVDGAGSIWRNSQTFRLNGTLNITNGGTVSIDPESVANLEALGGIVNVSGAGSLLTDGRLQLINGVLNITAGGKANTKSITVAESTVTIDGADSILTSSIFFDIGGNIFGTVVVQNGGQVHSPSPVVGGTENSANQGLLHVKSNGMVVVSTKIEVAAGLESRGTILVEGEGSTLTAPELYLGGEAIGLAGGSGRLTVNGGSVNVDDLHMFGGGQVHVNGGTLDVTGTLTRLEGSVVQLNGGTLRLRNAAAIQAFPDTFEWTGGTLQFTEAGLTVGNAGLFGSHLILNPRMSVQVAGPLDVNSGAQLVGTGGTVTGGGGLNNGTISIIGGSLSYSQPAVNNSLLDALRATLTFPGDGIKNNIGLTNNGTLTLAEAIVNGDVHSPTGSIINVAAGVVFNGLVSGGGSFPGAGTVTFNGGFSPGDSPATVTFGGGIELGPSGALELELGGTTPGSSFDHIDVAGLLSLDGALTVSLLDGFTPHYGDTFDLFNFAALRGRFGSLDLPVLSAGLIWDTSDLYSTGTITAVPEPAGWMFLLGGIAITAACSIVGRGGKRIA